MAIRHLTKPEVNRLLLTLTLAGYIPGRDFKVTENGQIMARKEILPIIERIPVLTDSDDEILHDQPQLHTSSFLGASHLENASDPLKTA
ncbi:MAG: hypothetical protein AAGA46_14860 [Cyanobacteria bacterium P01_F01_bin.13]